MKTSRQTETHRLRGFSILLIAMLLAGACKAVTGAFSPATPAPTSTRVAATPSATLEPGTSPTAIPQVNAAGVRYCYYVPGVSVPAQMPPEVLATPTPFVEPTVTPPPTSTVDAATTQKQLDEFQQLWQDVKDNYVYTDYNGHDWNAIGDKYRALINQGLSQDDFYTAMRDMIYELGDDHSRFESPDEVKQEEQDLAGQQDFVGIGALVQPLQDGNAGTIVAVFPNSPAAEAGLRLHDKVVAVDGGPWLDETTGKSRTLGEAGTQVTVTIERPGEQAHDISFTRRAVSGSLPIDYCIVPGTRIGYIYLPTFFDETIPDQVREALKKMTADGPLDGLILDNRMNAGGANTVADPILGFFTSGVQGHFVDRGANQSRPLDIKAEDINGSQTVPLAILVDLGTASYGEIFSGILRVAGRAKIVGQDTLGNVEVLHAFDFSDGSRAWIAAETFEPNGEANGIWERTGIIPDYYAPTRWDLFTEATDPALAKAVAVLQGNP
jgi:carboxyl-terminal processing protease